MTSASVDGSSVAFDTLLSDSLPLKEEKEVKDGSSFVDSANESDEDYQDNITASAFSVDGNINAVRSQVNIGHHVTDNRTVTICKAETVVQKFYDKRKCCQTAEAVDSNVQNVHMAKASSDFRAYIKEQHQRHLSKLRPLPWQAEFSLRLDSLYTTLQLNSPDHQGAKFTALEELFTCSEQDLCGTRLLLEGPPGYGKSTLTLKVAMDWIEEKEYLKKYSFLFLIQLADLKEDIPTYILNELLPPKLTRHEQVLSRLLDELDSTVIILLDGLNELNRKNRKDVTELLKGKVFGKATVMLTSRPLPSDDEILGLINKRVVIRGFSDTQLNQFVQSFFSTDTESAQELLALILDKNGSYRPLASCPLSCLSLCVLYQDGDGKLPSKVTEIYTNLIKWLIGRSVVKKSRINFKSQKLPEKYDKILREFGELCLQSLRNETVEFAKDEIIKKVKAPEIFGMGILVNTHTCLTRERIQKNECLQLVHNSFIEYITAYYMRSLIDESDRLEQALTLLLDVKPESVVLVLKFLMGLLGERAYIAIDMIHSFSLSDMNLFDLLRESGATPSNVRAISNILGQDFVTVRTTSTELDGWAHILSDPECTIKSLKMQRVSKEIDRVAVETFFDHLALNTSVKEFTIQTSYGVLMQEEDIEVLVSRMKRLITKANLEVVTIRIAGDQISRLMVHALSQSLRGLPLSSTLTSLNLHIDLETEELDVLCQALSFCGQISKLHLSKLSCGPEGYEALSKVLKYGKLESLKISLNLFKTVSSVEIEGDCGSPEDLRRLLPQLAENASRVASFKELENHGEDMFTSNTTVTSLAAKKFFNGSAAYMQRVEQTTPSCSPSHHKSGFHYLLSSLSVSTCTLKHLDLSNCYLTRLDLNCLGEAVVLTASLVSLTIVDLESFDLLAPVLQGLSATKTVSEVDVSSKKITVTDENLETMIEYLKGSSIVKTLKIAGWSGTFEDCSTLIALASYFERSALESLNLAGCKLQIKATFVDTVRKTSTASAASESSQNSFINQTNDSFESMPESRLVLAGFKRICETRRKWRSIQKLCLDSTEITLVSQDNDKEKILLKGPDYLTFLRFFVNLKEINFTGVKFHKTDALAELHARKVISLRDDATRKFFLGISKHFGDSLEKLQISNWDFNWSTPETTCKSVVKSLKQCPKLKAVVSNSVTYNEKSDRFNFFTSVVRGVPQLRKFSFEWCDVSERLADILAQKIVKYWRGNLLQMHTKFVSDDAVEAMTRQLKVTGRFRVESSMQGQINVVRNRILCGLIKDLNCTSNTIQM